MRKRDWLGWGVLLLAALGCEPIGAGAFSPTGYQNDTRGYKVSALPGTDASHGDLMPSDWHLDNYYFDQNAKGALKPKSTPEYKTQLEFDLNGDGATDKTEDAFIHDLRWIHARHHGVIWVRSVPVSTQLRDVDLDVLLGDYVNEVSGAGYEGVLFGGNHGVEEHRYVARITRKTPGRLAGQEAMDSEIEVANSEQIKLDPTARWQHVRLVLARGPVDHKERQGAEATSHPFPVVLVLGYENSPDHFAEGQPDFESLLSRFTVRELSGFVASSSPGAAVAGAPAATAVPTPPSASVSAAPAMPVAPIPPAVTSAPGL